jgi:hypothetical protein
MITLGIAKAIRYPEQPSEAILKVLAETATWCSDRSLRGTNLRSEELDPSAYLRMPPFNEFNIDAWIVAKRESYQVAVAAINEKRLSLLRGSNIEVVASAMAQLTGKLLLYEPLETVTDGASEAASNGFFDGDDAPPWDTWFLYSGGTIFCSIPESLVESAQAGIDANPVDCIHWSNWSKLPLRSAGS